MIYKINTEFELDVGDSEMTSVVTGIMGVTALAQVGKTIVSTAMKFIPGPIALVGSSISSATCSDLKTETPGPENRDHFETTLGENIFGSRPTLNDNGPTLTEKNLKTDEWNHNI